MENAFKLNTRKEFSIKLKTKFKNCYVLTKNYIELTKWSFLLHFNTFINNSNDIKKSRISKSQQTITSS